MVIKFYNTLSRKKEIFKPVENKKVRMYSCGPTVYDYIHIGNLRAYVFSDILRKYLEYSGYTVKKIVNITDVGHLTQEEIEYGIDKMEKAAKRENKDVWDIAEFYTEAFKKDCERMNIKEAYKLPRATEHIKEMIKLVEKLIEKKYAYVSNGSVYFDVHKFKNYGKLSGNTIEKLEAGKGGRVKHNPDKKSQLDFALWIKDKNHIMKWKSPWSVGYPGWHLECSAMSMKYLGETIDIHTGGEDNIFPHHESEIAQSEAANGKKFVKYWMHVRHLLVEGEKMSKSLGNFYTLQDLIDKGHSPKAVRYLLMSAHYRKPLNFTMEGLENSKITLDRMLEFMEKLGEVDGKKNPKVKDLIENVKNEFKEAMNDDLNTPIALSAIHDFISKINKLIDEKNVCKDDAKKINKIMQDFDKILGVLKIDKIKVPKEIKELLHKRKLARKNKDFKKSDNIREKIRNLGWEVQDTEKGQKLIKRI